MAGYAERNYISSVELDMRRRPYSDDDSFTTKLFKNFPLVGDFCFTETLLEKFYSNVKQYIDIAISTGEKRKYKQGMYDQVAILVINYAKSWNSSEEGKFSRYIAMQFGYKDDSGKVWRIITEALEIAFKSNNRLFVKSDNGDRQFYETVMVHSFGPADAWMPLIELLFRFYSENLDWNYIPGDPLFIRLVSTLSKYFENTVSDDDKYLIASNHYYLKVGIRRLIQERPGYCAYLFDRMVRRIHQLVHNEAIEAKKHSELLVDKWFANRINNAATIIKKSKGVKRITEEVALDYSKISPKYVLYDNLPALRIPMIRMLDESADSAIARIYDKDELISSVSLKIRGNELGKSIQGKTIPIVHYQQQGDDVCIRLVIALGNTVVYDSEKTLYRQVLVFNDEKEVSSSRIKREKYQIYAKAPQKLYGTNVDIVFCANGMCEVAFHKNFTLEYNGNAIAIDSDGVQGIRLVKPMVSEISTYVQNGECYSIVTSNSTLKVYCSDESTAIKYGVRINDETDSLSKYYDAVSGNRYVVPFRNIENNSLVSLSLVDMATSVVVYTQKYLVVSEYDIKFEKPFYFEDANFTDIKADVTICGDVHFVYAQNINEVVLDYSDGKIIIDVPCIKYRFVETGELFQNKYILADNLSETSSLNLINHTKYRCIVYIGDVSFRNDETIPLDWIKTHFKSNESSVDIIIEVEERKKLIGRILFEDQFVVPPKLLLNENTLVWDGGLTYVGKACQRFELLLMKSGCVVYSYPLIVGDPVVAVCNNFEDDEYICRVVSNSKIITEFRAFIGDERKVRFKGRTITIERVTEDVEDSSAAVKIKPVYIDQIKYVDTCYVETEDDIYDVYTGCMYWINYRDEKRYFSFKYNDARSKYKLNPVKIIYISNKYLRIVTEDDEGVFYFNNEYSVNPGNEITDNEPMTKDYHDILFYMYTVDKPFVVEQTAVVSAVPVSKGEEQNNVGDVLPAEEKTIQESDQLAIFLGIVETTQETVINASSQERILVNAGPGTGKTHTLIERIICLIQNGVDPEAIQVLCFSRAAVEVVRQRMALAIAENRVDMNSNKVDIRTFDSFVTQLLYWVKESDYDEIDSTEKIEALSYEDRISLFIDILRAEPQLIEQCEHLIVDEVQDLVLKRAEMVIEIIKLLPSDSGVTLFGDACQAIYDYQVEEGMSSTDFYTAIQNMRSFVLYSFSKNYRQVSALQNYCVEYRKAILENDIDLCNKSVAAIYEDLPDCTVPDIQNFQEDTLDSIVDKGTLGVLTRSNAQALIISGIFRKKNIPHIVQRRLGEDSLNGWIAQFFNQSPLKYYNEADFISLFNVICPLYKEVVDPYFVWEAISDTYSATTGRLSANDLILSIKHKGKCRGLFTEMQESDVVVSTIHRSKGREFDSVLLLDDLLASETDTAEEHRVNYVALSRARSHMYKVNLENAYFRTLENRRCFSVGSAYRSGSRYLKRFEVGKKDDLITSSYACASGVQKFIRENNRSLIGKEVYLRKDRYLGDGVIGYVLVLKENDMVLACTGESFSNDLSEAIRQIKKLPKYARVYENLFPSRLTSIYIVDVSSEIGITQGNEKDVTDHDGISTWNTLLLEGYAKAEY